MIDDVMSAFQERLHGEIPMLISMRACDSEGLSNVYKNYEAAASEQDKVYHQHTVLEPYAYQPTIQTVVPPIVTGLCAKSLQDGNNRPATPAKAVQHVAELLATKHAGARRFLPRDGFGEVRHLAFTGEEVSIEVNSVSASVVETSVL